jgi:hypothetical protein
MHTIPIVAAIWLAVSPAPQAGDDMTRIIPASTGVGCNIQASSDGSVTKLAAIVTTGGAMSGSYTLVVDRASDGSNVERREGEFASDSAGPTTVADLELPAEGGYRASLSVEWPNGSSSCSSSVS